MAHNLTRLGCINGRHFLTALGFMRRQASQNVDSHGLQNRLFTLSLCQSVDRTIEFDHHGLRVDANNALNQREKTVFVQNLPLDIIDQLFKKKNDRDLDPPVSWRHQSKGLVETF
jgi:hypothetical protein